MHCNAVAANRTKIMSNLRMKSAFFSRAPEEKCFFLCLAREARLLENF